MFCKDNRRNFGMWMAIAVAITAASMSSSRPRKAETPASPASHTVPRATLSLSLN
ncbi:hypothetical protein [Novosphingobium sp. 17-62-19]|uniref:hypothetical protein n=1 Tax=Novosphingobium sp. 17-62-19 TaxID=1970406 RepID=UPI0025F8BFCE|nr:hypothetical protein [Novosphingobium sp. 17-62-19]HQS95587.1 hypothetical protein [Novosphingobium sp.]